MKNINDTKLQSHQLISVIEQSQNLALECIKIGDVSKAKDICQNILKINPSHSPALHLLGIISCKSNEYEDSVSLIKKSLDIDPKNSVAHFNLGLTFTEKGELEMALSHFNKAISITPGLIEAHVHIGHTLKNLNRIDEAFDSCYKALGCISNEDPYIPFFSLLGHPERHYWMIFTISLLQNLQRPVSILEVGSWLGSSLLTWDQSISGFHKNGGDILCVDHWEPHFRFSDLNGDDDFYNQLNMYSAKGLSYEIFCHNERTAQCGVTHRRGSSQDILPKLDSAAFDIVYVDGSHYYDDVIIDIQEGCRLVREGGYLCGDDLEIQWRDVNHQFTLAHKNEDYILDEKRGPYHPGVTSAVFETLGPVTCREGFWIMQKVGDEFKPVELKKRLNYFTPAHFSGEWKERFNNYAEQHSHI